MRSWTDWYWLWWLVIAVGIGFGVPEAVALLDSDPETQPFTLWTVERGLALIAAGVGLWLSFHFYRRRRHG